jgi:demethylmenaquinone methyltransferase/2-methoxy-6-polyprenyl-1,4-benzoquinol methylase
MSLQQRDLFIKHIFSTVAPYVDLLSSGFSLGFDHLWRTKTVSLSGIHEGEQVLDVCTGTGELALLLARKVGPRGSVTGADFCEEMLHRARKKTGRNPNITYILSDAKHLPFGDNTFDAVTVSFGMRNIPDTTYALREIKRVLKPGGKFICLELTRPRPGWFRHIYEWYVFRIMPFVAEMVVKTAAPYLYLPRSIKAFYQPDEFRGVIAECGYSDVTVESLTMGIATIYRAVKHG